MTTAPTDSATTETADAVGIRSSALFGLRPYYEDSHITLYHGDCVEIMRAMEGVSVDAVITDPPYCSGGALEAQKNSGGQGHRSERLASGEVEWFAADNMTTGGLVWLVRAVLVESRRVMKANRSAFVFTDWRMVPHLAPALESSGLRYRNMIVWDKMSAGLGMGFKPAHEIILEYTNGVTEYATKDGQNVIRSRRVTSATRDHACQKPLEVLAKLIDVAVPPGGTVLDPFSGSGSTLVAAKQRGRKAIGIELAESHCETIARRCAQEMALFMDCPNNRVEKDKALVNAFNAGHDAKHAKLQSAAKSALPKPQKLTACEQVRMERDEQWKDAQTNPPAVGHAVLGLVNGTTKMRAVYYEAKTGKWVDVNDRPVTVSQWRPL